MAVEAGAIWDSEILYLTSGTGEIKSVRLAKYPDGMPLVDTMSGFRRVERVLLRPRSMDAFVAAMFWVDALVDRGHGVPSLILPFVPGSRQDRLNGGGDYLFTAKSVAGMINARRFPRVTIIDPHSDVAPALIDRCAVVGAATCLPPTVGFPSYAAVISPDAGAEKRAGAVAKALGVPLIHAWKTRDVATGKICGFGVQELAPGLGRVLVVDDICDGGGTFMGLKDAMPGQIAADLYVSHGLFSLGTSILRSRYDTIYTTDSIIGAPRDGVTVLPICDRLLKGYA